MKTKIFYIIFIIAPMFLINSSCTCDDDNCTEQTWYQDLDQDGFGNSNVSLLSCTQPDDYVLDNTDCHDQDRTIYPGAIELCDGSDNDCNGEIDEGFDQDQDGFSSCFDGDCDDTNPDTYPGAPEICNDGIDNNCDGEVDEGC